MLSHAIARLKLPSTFISLITNIFTERKNRVFTAVGTTDPYEVLVGIDQGEVMSPLIWCMYYDPLLCEIESRELGYNLLHEQKTNVYDNQYNLASVDIADVTYMDDTTWITESKEALEEILAIADDFYKLNNIQVNKSKPKLLVNSPHDTLPETVELTFGSDKVQIKPAKIMNL